MVAGGAGFIGSHLTDSLLGMGHRVICVDNFLLGTRDNVAHLRGAENYVLHEQDVCDIYGMRRIFRKESVDYVFHLAANSDIRSGGRDPRIDLDNTYMTTFNLLECMREFNVKRLFFSSTSAVYGERQGAATAEDAGSLRPVSYYGAAKLGGEALISAYGELCGIKSLVFRFPNVIGSRLTHGVIYDFIGKLKSDPTRLRILGDGRQTKPYMHVSDLINGITKFMDNDAGMDVYNIGVETRTDVTRIADIICAAMGLVGVAYEYSGGRGGWPGDVPEFSFDLSRIKAKGFKALYTSDEAVRKTAEELCAR